MAHYLVTAKPKSDRLPDLLDNLRKNKYASMRPFGKTMTYSLQNARQTPCVFPATRPDADAHLTA
jgi:hypothetical protein